VSPAATDASAGGPAEATPPEGDVIGFEHVGLSFGAQRVLQDIGFHVGAGETKVLLGEAASGKTLILKLTLGLLKPDSGRVVVLGRDVTAMSEDRLYELRRSIGIVFQESALFDSLTVRENVAYRLVEEGGLDDDAIDERVRTCLRFVELEDAIDKMPAELSGGMRRRVSIARALSTEPKVMLYDSPTGGLDPETSTTIMELIIKLRDVNGVTGLLVTHRLQDGFLMATHGWDQNTQSLRAVAAGESRTSFLVLHEGRVLFDGAANELVSTRDSYLRNYIS
jgi:phospholipid/cholesterol/gamma-HCH transport system ATP-binding protein